ncbi:hypothetical protein K0M31_001255 [Melipona bicolor]|uniref:Uncharacterized protein n=1 Tax=Melipona bicolor TaxID=60889 RepID=A0AA40KXG8_9HYME|nr:hypothetical protein K0M31_001255 [Melipona bicolor]
MTKEKRIKGPQIENRLKVDIEECSQKGIGNPEALGSGQTVTVTPSQTLQISRKVQTKIFRMTDDLDAFQNISLTIDVRGDCRDQQGTKCDCKRGSMPSSPDNPFMVPVEFSITNIHGTFFTTHMRPFLIQDHLQAYC